MARLCSLTARFENTPVSAFNRIDDAASLTACLEAIAGGEVTLRPVYHAAHLGTWENGWTATAHVTADKHHSAEVVALRIYDRRLAENIGGLATLSRGRVIEMLSRTMNAHPTTADDTPGLAMALASSIAKASNSPDPSWPRWGWAGALNAFDDAWMLHHALATLDAETRAATEMMYALALGVDRTARVNGILAGVENFTQNRQQVSASETAIRDAVHRLNGTTLSGAGVEKTNLAGALMLVPFDEWEATADRLVARLAEQDPGLLVEHHERRAQQAGKPRSWLPLAG